MIHTLFTTRATFRVFKIERKLYGKEDLNFLERVFQKLLLNFTWFEHPLQHRVTVSDYLLLVKQVGEP